MTRCAMTSTVSTDTRPALRDSGDERARISCRAQAPARAPFPEGRSRFRGPCRPRFWRRREIPCSAQKIPCTFPARRKKKSLLARAGNFAVKTLKSKGFSAHFFTKKGRFPAISLPAGNFPRRGAYPTSKSRSASASSTETIWLTPRSAIVTPNSRSMRAMVIGLWVMVTKRVLARLRISSRRSQKRSTL